MTARKGIEEFRRSYTNRLAEVRSWYTFAVVEDEFGWNGQMRRRRKEKVGLSIRLWVVTKYQGEKCCLAGTCASQREEAVENKEGAYHSGLVDAIVHLGVPAN